MACDDLRLQPAKVEMQELIEISWNVITEWPTICEPYASGDGRLVNDSEIQSFAVLVHR